METHAEVEEFLRRWAATSEARDADGNADLYVRDPAPLVVFSDGERARDWLDVRVRLGRDFQRAIIERVDVEHVRSHEIADDVLLASFVYELTARDLWGMSKRATRLATMTLVRTKDGLRIAQAHFSPAR